MGRAGAVPDYVRGVVIVPCVCFSEYLGTRGGGGEVGAYVVKALG